MTAATGDRPQSARSSAHWSPVASIALSDSRTIKNRDVTEAYCQFDHWDNSFGQFLRIRCDGREALLHKGRPEVNTDALVN